MRELDACLNNVTSKVDVILVGGTNGKSLTIHFASKLLKEEGIKAAVGYSNHVLNYNERFVLDLQPIANKAFTDVLNEVINTAEVNNIKATAFELLTMAHLLHASNERADVLLLEVGYGGQFDATNICHPKIAAVTRVTNDSRGILGTDLDKIAFEMLEIAKPGTWFISAEQSKIRLQKMKQFTDARGVKWAMPIRKLASLPYVFEQLFGRAASLGERIAQIYVEDIKGKFSPFLRGNLLATQRGQRGRPTLEAKRQAELNPIKTLKSFWNEEFDLLRGRFELLDKEKPSILLDNASNADALTNLFLGIRLVHYQKPVKGISIILGLSKAVDLMEAFKVIRYGLKKVNGNIFFITLSDDVQSHNAQDLANKAKEFNIKAKACNNLTEAFEQAKPTVDERDGLVVIAGSQTIISEYWISKGIKKF
jgi:dihydrofolate synthase/folylpolyglutamate synthase